MITNPQNPFEQSQNEIAAAIKAVAPFKDIKFPDGSTFDVLTEDEGDPEMLFTAQIAKAGLSVIVQSPTGKIVQDGQLSIQISPIVIAVSISEAILFNRDTNNPNATKVRLMVAVKAVLKTLHGFPVPSLGQSVFATRILKDRDTQPETDALVASRIITFEATEVRVDLT